ncbi:MAG: 4Fe-4S dicluster domain-containing protein [Candidatus Krumholzibacteria bacterium]|nr:4Fe-4S dicluster domain-containing protein [Candidatus Krumholzibacteria bacterium]
MQKAFVLDINKCTGCQACQLACSIENELAPHMNWRQVSTFNEHHHPAIPSFHLSLACNHCVDPPCMTHCPALAYTKDLQTGAVTLDPSSCIGCRYCAWACPYDAPQFNPVSGLMEKCTFCNHRMSDGLEPACVTSCPTGALRFGDHHGINGDASVLGFPRARAKPAIRFIALHDGRNYPQAASSATESHASQITGEPGGAPAAKIRLRSEWTLVTFTLLAAWLVGAFVSSATQTPSLVGTQLTGASLVTALSYTAAGALTMALSALHLGRRRRAYRAVLNWRRSWLSREVILLSTFLVMSSAYLLLGVTNAALRWIVVLIGLSALYAVDRVYHVTATHRLEIHSARMLLTGVLFTGLMSENAVVFLTTCGIKLLLYGYRKIWFFRNQYPVRPRWSLTRIVIGLALPMVVWTVGPAHVLPLVAMGVVVGEVIDRCEFYVELDVPTPRKQMARDLDIEIDRVLRRA